MKFVLTASLMLLIALADHAMAMAPVPLPAVSLTNGSGETISAAQIGKENRVLLVLVRRSFPGSDRLLSYLNGLNPELTAGRVIIIASGADEKLLRTLSSRFKNLSTAVWYLDRDEHLMKQLGIQATPVVIGVRNATVSWSIVGMLDEKKMEGLLRGWIIPEQAADGPAGRDDMRSRRSPHRRSTKIINHR